MVGNQSQRVLPFALLVALLAITAVFGQDAPVQYTQAEYDAYQRAVEGGEDTIVAFLKENPSSSLAQYAVGAYLQLMQGYQQKGDHESVVSAGEKYLNGVDSGKFEMLYLTTWSSFYSGQYAKAAQYGEQTYKVKADAPQLVPILARSYQQLGEKAKAIPWAEQTCAQVAAVECFDLLPGLMVHYAQEKAWASAAKYAKGTIEALDAAERPAQIGPDDWGKYVREQKATAYTIIGKQAFESKDWAGTEENFRRSQQIDPHSIIRRAEAHYYIGMALWSLKQLDPAMEAFAKGAVLSGTGFSEPCRNQLEVLYRSTHNDSLQGIDDYISRVTGD